MFAKQKVKVALRRRKRKMKKEEKWECKLCGKCCTFIVIPVQKKINLETEAYLMAHGIALLPPPAPSPTGGGPGRGSTKLVIPARCKYLGSDNKCRIHAHKFPNCSAGGEKECKEAKSGWYLLNSG